MTLDEIDNLLVDWQSKLSVASNNLLELDALTTFKRLSGDGSLAPARLTGTTLSRVQPALDAITELWKSLQALNDIVARAAEMRKAIPRLWVTESAIRAIYEVLTGPSIRLAAPVTPLEQRGLLSVPEQHTTMSPTDLLALMSSTFEPAKRVILDVDAAWTRLEPDLATCDGEVRTLQSIGDLLGESAVPELVAVRQRLAAVQLLVQSDPLGVTTNLAQGINPLLKAVRDRLSALKSQREEVQNDLSRGQRRLQELNDLHERCYAALAECRDQIDNPSGVCEPISQSAIDDLAKWLRTLDDTVQQGRWQPAGVGIKRWLQTAEAYIATETSSYQANKNPLEMCAEMKGRLASLRAKAQAYVRRGIVVDVDTESLAARAERMLAQKPIHLAGAAALVTEYEMRIARAMARAS